MSTQTEPDTGTDKAKAAASEVAGQAGDQAGAVADTAKSEAKTVVADAKEQAADVLHKSRTELRDRAGEQTKALSSTLGDFATQLTAMADGGGDPQSQVARLAKSAADQMHQGAQRLDEGGLDGLAADLKDFARNRPGAFLLGSVAAGFAIGRLAKHADLQQSAQKAKDAATPDDGPGSSPTNAGGGDQGGQQAMGSGSASGGLASTGTADLTSGLSPESPLGGQL